MRLISLGAITPLGAKLSEHVKALETAEEKKVDFLEYKVADKRRKVAVYRACEPSVSLPVPDAVLRRMGLSTKLVLSSIEEARSYTPTDFTNKRVGLIVGTTQGPSSTNIEYFKKLVAFNYRGASPNLFAQSVHNNIASSVALTYSWKGPTLTLVQETNLLDSVMAVAGLWAHSKKVDYIWIVLGNELSLHLPYIQLYEHLKENPGAESFIPPRHDICFEAFSSFLISTNSSEGVADINKTKIEELLRQKEQKEDRSLRRPELLGVSLAEYYYKECFLNKA